MSNRQYKRLMRYGNRVRREAERKAWRPTRPIFSNRVAERAAHFIASAACEEADERMMVAAK